MNDALGYLIEYNMPVQNENIFLQSDYDGKYKGSIAEYWQLRNASVDNKMPEITPADMHFWKANYDAKILEADRRFGEFIKRLDRLDVFVIATSVDPVISYTNSSSPL